MVNVTRYTVTPEMKLKAVVLYDPISNSRHSVLLDVNRGLLIGLESTHVYKPAGGAHGCFTIINSGFVIDSVVYGFDCRHAHDNVYMLESY